MKRSVWKPNRSRRTHQYQLNPTIAATELIDWIIDRAVCISIERAYDNIWIQYGSLRMMDQVKSLAAMHTTLTNGSKSIESNLIVETEFEPDTIPQDCLCHERVGYIRMALPKKNRMTKNGRSVLQTRQNHSNQASMRSILSFTNFDSKQSPKEQGSLLSRNVPSKSFKEKPDLSGFDKSGEEPHHEELLEMVYEKSGELIRKG